MHFYQKLKSQYTLKDWRLWFKLSFILVLTTAVLVAYIYPLITGFNYVADINQFLKDHGEIKSIEGIIDYFKTNSDSLPSWITKSAKDLSVIKISSLIIFRFEDDQLKAFFDPFEKIIIASTFFTMISNLMILAWMYTAFFKPQNEGKKGYLNMRYSILVATYITVTFLIYQFFLRPTMYFQLGVWWLGWVQGIENEIFHTVAPIAFVSYILFGMKATTKEDLTFKKLKTTWLIGMLGLIGYGLLGIIKGLLKVAGGTSQTSNDSFPYFFLQITNNNVLGTGIHGIVFFLIFVVIISGVFIGFSSLYRWVIYKFHYRQNN